VNTDGTRLGGKSRGEIDEFFNTMGGKLGEKAAITSTRKGGDTGYKGMNTQRQVASKIYGKRRALYLECCRWSPMGSRFRTPHREPVKTSQNQALAAQTPVTNTHSIAAALKIK
jgi:hypothetical protein